MKAIREEMKTQQDQTVNRLLSVLVKEDQEGKTVFGKKTFKSLVNGKKDNLSLFTADCDYNDPIFFDAAAKDILPVKKALEEVIRWFRAAFKAARYTGSSSFFNSLTQSQNTATSEYFNSQSGTFVDKCVLHVGNDTFPNAIRINIIRYNKIV